MKVSTFPGAQPTPIKDQLQLFELHATLQESEQILPLAPADKEASRG